MSDVQRIIKEVDSSMKMEGFTLSEEDKARIEDCLKDPAKGDRTLKMLIEKHKAQRIN
nr:hypothetical protein [Clostridia bacterium]